MTNAKLQSAIIAAGVSRNIIEEGAPVTDETLLNIVACLGMGPKMASAEAAQPVWSGGYPELDMRRRHCKNIGPQASQPIGQPDDPYMGVFRIGSTSNSQPVNVPSDLHAEIMNLQCTPPSEFDINQRLAYKYGHRDARHAAAELAAAPAPVVAKLPQPVQTEAQPEALKTLSVDMDAFLAKWKTCSVAEMGHFAKRLRTLVAFDGVQPAQTQQSEKDGLLDAVVDAAHNAIDHVGRANYEHRVAEAHEMVEAAIAKEKAKS